MIQVEGQTYRIVEIGRAIYRAVRIADETAVGVFHCGPPLQLWDCDFTANELGEVARTAVRAGKTRWGRAAEGRSQPELAAVYGRRSGEAPARSDTLRIWRSMLG